MMIASRNPIDPIGQNHHVGRLGRGGGAAGAHRNPHIGGRESRRVVDAVADHDGRMEALLGAHRVDLVGGNAVGEHGIEIQRGAHRLRRIRTVARDHDDAANARSAQQADGVRRFGAQFVGKQERPDRPLLHGDEDDQRRSPRGAAYRPQRPFIGMPVRDNHVGGAAR